MSQGGEEAAGAGSHAAGAGIKEMAPQGYLDMYLTDWFAAWDRLGQLRTPTIAVVSGSPSAVAANSPCSATSCWPPTPPCSDSRRSNRESSRASAASSA
ncbi:hypothetical protein Srufu_076240 [Streptomyces libani subsp. rufus]|nr:hypothetical protein Srufu_076240 [Streptomyces libani subsp. rufus]